MALRSVRWFLSKSQKRIEVTKTSAIHVQNEYLATQGTGDSAAFRRVHAAYLCARTWAAYSFLGARYIAHELGSSLVLSSFLAKQELLAATILKHEREASFNLPLTHTASFSGTTNIQRVFSSLVHSAPLRAGAHTDTTFLTVIPCASAPGLEILQPSTGRWVRPEAARKCQPGCDVMLLAGELLQVLGRGRYQAAVHRVVRPADLVEPRVSTPLLVRGRAGAVVRDSMLPPAVTDRLEERSGEPRHAAAGSPPSSATEEEGGKLTMTDLWAALQFRGGATTSEDESFCGGSGEDSTGEGPRSVPSSPPLAQAKTEEQIRRRFGPFARDGVSVLSLDPLLVRLHGFVSAEECKAIINQGSATFAESTTWGGADAQAESDVLRTSSTTWLADDSLASPPGARDTPLLESMTESVCGMSGLPSAFMEKWQVFGA